MRQLTFGKTSYILQVLLDEQIDFLYGYVLCAAQVGFREQDCSLAALLHQFTHTYIFLG